jgi:drug/metabolite transporter (DMT)-like permease
VDYLISQIAQAAARGLEPSTGRIQRSVVGAAIIAIFAGIALLSLFATGWFAVYERQGPVVASAYMTLAAVVLALLAWAIVAILNKRAQRLWEEERRRQALASSARSSGTMLALTELPG